MRAVYLDTIIIEEISTSPHPQYSVQCSVQCQCMHNGECMMYIQSCVFEGQEITIRFHAAQKPLHLGLPIIILQFVMIIILNRVTM